MKKREKTCPGKVILDEVEFEAFWSIVGEAIKILQNKRRQSNEGD